METEIVEYIDPYKSNTVRNVRRFNGCCKKNTTCKQLEVVKSENKNFIVLHVW